MLRYVVRIPPILNLSINYSTYVSRERLTRFMPCLFACPKDMFRTYRMVDNRSWLHSAWLVGLEAQRIFSRHVGAPFRGQKACPMPPGMPVYLYVYIYIVYFCENKALLEEKPLKTSGNTYKFVYT